MRHFPIHPQLSAAAPPAATGREIATAGHRDSSALIVQGSDGIRLSGARLDPASAPATVVFVHGMLTDCTYWSPLTEYLRQRLYGGIAQIAYDKRRHGSSDPRRAGSRATMDVLVDGLDAVLATATGAVVLVAHSLLVPAWIAAFPHRARRLAGVGVEPGKAAELILAAREVAYRTRQQNRCPC